MIIPISYPLSIGSPLYPGTPPIRIEPGKSIGKGDSANTSTLIFSSHAGTHVDLPRHFCRDGRSVSSLFRPVNEFFPAYVLDLPVEGDHAIMADNLETQIAGRENAGAILIRTGAWRARATDPGAYATSHPWIHAGVAALLRKRCSRLRLVGIDTISIATPSHREDGRASHRAFLCDERPLCLLEDANLSSVTSMEGYTLMVMPWLVDDLDGVPVCAFLVSGRH